VQQLSKRATITIIIIKGGRKMEGGRGASQIQPRVTYKKLWSVRKSKAVADHGLMTSFATDTNQVGAPDSRGKERREGGDVSTQRDRKFNR